MGHRAALTRVVRLGVGGIAHASQFLMPEGLWRRGNKPNLNFQATKDGAGSCESLTCLVSAMHSEDSTRQMVLLHNFGVCGHSTAMVAWLC